MYSVTSKWINVIFMYITFTATWIDYALNRIDIWNYHIYVNICIHSNNQSILYQWE